MITDADAFALFAVGEGLGLAAAERRGRVEPDTVAERYGDLYRRVERA